MLERPRHGGVRNWQGSQGRVKVIVARTSREQAAVPGGVGKEKGRGKGEEEQDERASRPLPRHCPSNIQTLKTL